MATKNRTSSNAAALAAKPVSPPPAPDFTEDRKQQPLSSKLAGSIGSPLPSMPTERPACAAPSEPLKTIVHAQSNVLHDVATLLDALRAALEQVDTDDDIDPLFRLAQMAKVKVAGTISAFNAHI